MLLDQTIGKASVLLAALTVAVAFSVQARAEFLDASNSQYGIIAGPGTNSMQFSNSTFNGNVATDNPTTTPGGNYVQFSSGTIIGNFSFVGLPQTNLGAGTLIGSRIGNDSGVSTAYNSIAALSNTFAGEAGTPFSGAGTLNASNGTVDPSGNFVFTTTASNFLNAGALVINGTAGQNVVLNVTGNNNVQINKNSLALTGGLTPDNVFINITGNGGQIGLLGINALNSGVVVNGIIVGLNDKFNVDNMTVNGRIIGGDNQDFQLVSGFNLNSPPPVPEPVAVVSLLGLAGMGLIGMVRRRRRAAVG